MSAGVDEKAGLLTSVTLIVKLQAEAEGSDHASRHQPLKVSSGRGEESDAQAMQLWAGAA